MGTTRAAMQLCQLAYDIGRPATIAVAPRRGTTAVTPFVNCEIALMQEPQGPRRAVRRWPADREAFQDHLPIGIIRCRHVERDLHLATAGVLPPGRIGELTYRSLRARRSGEVRLVARLKIVSSTEE